MDPEQVKKMIAEAVGAALAPVAKEIAELKGSVGQVAEAGNKIGDFEKKLGEVEKNQGILGETLAKLPPVNPESIKKLVGETLTAHKADADKAAAGAKAKSDWLAKNAPKLTPTFQKLIPDTDDPAKLDEAGKAAIAAFEAEFKVSGPKVSAAAAGTGGNAPGTGAGAKDIAVNGMTPGVASYAASIKLPGSSAAPAAGVKAATAGEGK